jgi:hypothetical protein
VFDGPYVDAVKRAVKAGFGKEPAFIREGGSIGAVVTMQKAWKVPISVSWALSLPEHGYHAPNEYFDWGQASGGMKAFVHYFGELAKDGEDDREQPGRSSCSQNAHSECARSMRAVKDGQAIPSQEEER